MDQTSPATTNPISPSPATPPIVESNPPKKFEPFNLVLIVMGIGVIALAGLIIYLLTQRQQSTLIAAPSPTPVMTETLESSPSSYENPFTETTEEPSSPSAMELEQDASVSSNPFETPPVNPFEGLE